MNRMTRVKYTSGGSLHNDVMPNKIQRNKFFLIKLLFDFLYIKTLSRLLSREGVSPCIGSSNQGIIQQELPG